MLFRDFFPRLRDRALERYGEIITERQFKDWREDGLLPGPSTPIGRGRGRSPERHWPVASYRRALRICRYKSWTARRQSEWWLGFWLSGETVEPQIIRAALKREFSIERRSKRSFIESNRWRTSEFETIEDAERGGASGEKSLAGFLKLSKMTPDQFRRLSILELNDRSDAEAETLYHEILPIYYGFDYKSDVVAEIRADIAPDEIKRSWRHGHMDDGADISGRYLDRLPDSEFGICLKILELTEHSIILNYTIQRLQRYLLPEQSVVFLFAAITIQTRFLKWRIAQLLIITFQIDADKRESGASSWRLDGWLKSVSKLEAILEEIILKRREKRLQ